MQEVICPFCIPQVEKFSNTSTLRRHVDRQHPASKISLFQNTVVYYFATNPAAFRSITKPEVGTDDAREARNMLKRWASLSGLEQAEAVYTRAVEDWATLGSKRMGRKPENEATAAKNILVLISLNIGSAESVAIIQCYGQGVYGVKLGPGAIRTLARKPKTVHVRPSAIAISDKDNHDKLSEVLGLADSQLLKTVTWHPLAAISLATLPVASSEVTKKEVKSVAPTVPSSPIAVEDSDSESLCDLPGTKEEPQQVPTAEHTVEPLVSGTPATVCPQQVEVMSEAHDKRCPSMPVSELPQKRDEHECSCIHQPANQEDAIHFITCRVTMHK